MKINNLKIQNGGKYIYLVDRKSIHSITFRNATPIISFHVSKMKVVMRFYFVHSDWLIQESKQTVTSLSAKHNL